MKCFPVCGLLIAAVFGSTLAGFAKTPVAAHQGQTAVEGERALNEALGKTDRAEVARLLDSEFEWTDKAGKMRTKAEVLQAMATLAADTQDETEIQQQNYGDVERFVGRRQNTRFVHLWVKRADGWRAFQFLDAPIPAGGYSYAPTRTKVTDCINPCKVLPFKPANAAQQGAVNAWLGTKMGEWHSDEVHWPNYISETMITISPRMYMNKAERKALLVEQKKTYGDGPPSPPVISMHMYDFGNAVIMTSVHGPGATGKRARALRLFVKEDGVWRLALSAQTDVEPPAS